MKSVTDPDLPPYLAYSLISIGEAVAVIISDNVFEYVNPAFEKMFGYSNAELIGE